MFSKHRLTCARVPQCSKSGPSRKTRLTFVLRALDGSLAGTSHRDVAGG
ncbi:DNA -binding domain-containing protein [Mesorhizobium ciceri]